jgi:Fe-S cluster biogenesis protein NfuA
MPKPEHQVPPEPAEPPAGEMRAGIEEAIEAIRPALQMDGGDVTLINVDETTGVVDIELIGACVGCPASTMTLKAGIERILKDRVDGITEVNAVGLEPALDF